MEHEPSSDLEHAPLIDRKNASSSTVLAEQLTELGVNQGSVLLVHSSYRAIRPVIGGPAGLLDALLSAVGPQGTVVMPSWGARSDVPFDRASTATATDLGVLAETLWHHPDSVRSEHQFAFAAIGPQARDIVEGEITFPPHAPGSPVGIVHDLDGQVLLLGVGHDANTTIHLAEIVGAAPYRVEKTIVLLENGRPVSRTYGENDHCCANFVMAEQWLDAERLIRRGRVGRGTAQLCRSRDIVRVVGDRIRRDPLIFLHSAVAGCEECDHARATVSATP